MPQPAKHPDLHGNVPDDRALALLLIDVLNPLDFEGSEEFARACSRSGSPRGVQGTSDRGSCPRHLRQRQRRALAVRRDRVVRNATRDDARVPSLAPARPRTSSTTWSCASKHSGFYSTPLDILLTYLRTERVILTGLSAERCVLFTANDAFLRDYELFVPSDCTAAIDDRDYAAALRILERVLGATTTPRTSSISKP